MTARLEAAHPGTLRPLWAAAAWLPRSEETLRDWYKRGLLSTTACDVRTRQVLVDLVEVAALHLQRPARAPRRRAAAVLDPNYTGVTPCKVPTEEVCPSVDRTAEVALIWSRIYPRLQLAPNGCLAWPGAKNPAGYGNITRRGKCHSTHRIAFEACRGPIPEGMQLDHLCRNTACCNPWHLQVVTPRTNVERGSSPFAAKMRQQHCLRGHAFTVDNTIRRPNGTRACATCRAGYRTAAAS